MNEIIDYSEALTIADGDKELLKELIRLFLDDYPLRLERVRQAIATSDAEELARAACNLRTLTGILAAQRECETLLVLETMGINDDLENAETVCLQLQDQLKELERELLKYEKAVVV